MPTTINKIFENAGIKKINRIPWGNSFTDNNQGVYVVALNEEIITPDFDGVIIKSWIAKLPYFQIDNKIPTVELLKKRLMEFWLPDEQILYIGKAPNRTNGKGISNRIAEYYRTDIGNKSPHSGGQWIKTLKNLATATVYYGHTNNPDNTEITMLDFFMKNVSENTLNKLRDKNYPLPFANLRYKARIDKNHGLAKQRLQ